MSIPDARRQLRANREQSIPRDEASIGIVRIRKHDHVVITSGRFELVCIARA